MMKEKLAKQKFLLNIYKKEEPQFFKKAQKFLTLTVAES